MSGVGPGSGSGFTGGTTSGAEPGCGSGSGLGFGSRPGTGGGGVLREVTDITEFITHRMQFARLRIAILATTRNFGFGGLIDLLLPLF